MSEHNILIEGRVTYDNSAVGVVNATVRLYNVPASEKAEMLHGETCTEADGVYSIAVPLGAGDYVVRCTAFGWTGDKPFSVAGEEKTKTVHIELPLQLSLNLGASYQQHFSHLRKPHTNRSIQNSIFKIFCSPVRFITGKGFVQVRTYPAI